MNKKIIICLNTAWNLYNFRTGLIRTLVAQGYEVVAVAPYDEYAPRLNGLGCRFVNFPIDNQGTNPWRDFLLLVSFFKLLLRERPAAYLGFTIKPNIYGSLVAHAIGIPVINNIAGLGAVFIKNGWLRWFVTTLYRLALRRSKKVFFQNSDDQKMFIEGGLVGKSVAALLPGSGIDLEHFSSRVRLVDFGSSQGRPFQFLLHARMLWDKGVGEFVEAARLLGGKGLQVEFLLMGFVNVPNPAAIPQSVINTWVSEGCVKFIESSDDVRTAIAEADCIVLPSYREGIPRSLLEAAAMAKPIITTDVSGCRDVVTDGVNGFLCKVGDAQDLAQCMEKMVNLTLAQRAAMGAVGRLKMERHFDERIVFAKYIDALSSNI
jgi:glycosyltransferase involved in cell wall biosynthesis